MEKSNFILLLVSNNKHKHRFFSSWPCLFCLTVLSFFTKCSLFSFNFSPPDTTVHHVPGSGHQPPSDALIHQDFEKQKSFSPLLRWPLPLIALSITPGGWSIWAPPTPLLCLLLFYSTLYFFHVWLSAAGLSALLGNTAAPETWNKNRKMLIEIDFFLWHVIQLVQTIHF